MVTLAFALVAYVRAFFVSRHKLAVEADALRQQLAVFKRKQIRPKLHRLDRLFWIALRHLWSGWAEALIIVKPETVVSWHRAGFRLFWRLRSRSCRSGRPKVSQEIRQLICIAVVVVLRSLVVGHHDLLGRKVAVPVRLQREIRSSISLHDHRWLPVVAK